jgi:hypothetical protein
MVVNAPDHSGSITSENRSEKYLTGFLADPVIIQPVDACRQQPDQRQKKLPLRFHFCFAKDKNEIWAGLVRHQTLNRRDEKSQI